jgi:hypothetical protein
MVKFKNKNLVRYESCRMLLNVSIVERALWIFIYAFSIFKNILPVKW